MPATRRQPLSELPLSSFVVAANTPRTDTKRGKSPFDAKLLLSPPKRRILSEEGFASPSKSPARRLLFRTMAEDITPPNSLTGLLRDGGLEESFMDQSGSGSRPISISSSFASAASSATVVSSQTAAPSSPSQLSISTFSLLGTPPATRARTRSLAPSPELPDSPMARDTTPDPLPVSRPATLKRLRSAGSANSTTSSSPSAHPPTPKRRNVASETVSVDAYMNEEDNEAENDKENVPPRKKKVVATKGAPSTREASATPRMIKQRGGATEHLTPEERRSRRAALEAEVDDTDEF